MIITTFGKQKLCSKVCGYTFYYSYTKTYVFTNYGHISVDMGSFMFLHSLLPCNCYKKSLCSDKHVQFHFAHRKCTVAAAGNFSFYHFWHLKGFILIYNLQVHHVNNKSYYREKTPKVNVNIVQQLFTERDPETTN